MLVLSRTPGEELVIGDNIRLTVLGIRGKKVRLGITAPLDMPIRRQELGRLENGCNCLHFQAANGSPPGSDKSGPAEIGQ